MKKILFLLSLLSVIFFISCNSNIDESSSEEPISSTKVETSVTSSDESESSSSTSTESSDEESKEIESSSSENQKSSVGEGELPSDDYSWSPISWAK